MNTDPKGIIKTILNDPPEARWRSVRALSRVKDETEKAEAVTELKKILESEALDPMTDQRVQLAIRMNSNEENDAGRTFAESVNGLFTDIQATDRSDEFTGYPFPVVDVHVHPKKCDAGLLADLRGMKAVFLATDTDPDDMDRPEVIEHVRGTYEHSDISRFMPFDRLIAEIRGSLRSVSHVSNQDVADWAADYPDTVIGFGSVDLCKSEDYVMRTLEWITAHGLKGIKLLPFSQFFDPAESRNADMMMEYCSRHGLAVLSHTGCSAGVFESPYLNMYSRPSRWEKLAVKYPDVPLVLAHFGSYSEMMPGIWFEEAINLMKKCSNVYSDTAAVWRLLWNEEMVGMIRSNDLFGQVLFGTDYPMLAYLPGGERGVVQSILDNELLTDTEKEMLLGENALKFLK